MAKANATAKVSPQAKALNKVQGLKDVEIASNWVLIDNETNYPKQVWTVVDTKDYKNGPKNINNPTSTWQGYFLMGTLDGKPSAHGDKIPVGAHILRRAELDTKVKFFEVSGRGNDKTYKLVNTEFGIEKGKIVV